MKKALSLLLFSILTAGSAAWAGPVYTLNDGQVYADGSRLDWEVVAVPETAKGRIKHWTDGFRPGEGENEGENVAVFFDGEGRSVGEIVINGQFRGLIWNQDGSRLVLSFGSGVRPDIFFIVYGADLKPQSEELGGQAESLQWADAARLIYTRIDDLRENGYLYGLNYGVELSVVLYDCVSRRELPLKTATDTANFSLISVSPDGRKAVILEESVATPTDWGVEDKINSQELEVAIPAGEK